jgi:hypothetical protein
MTMFMSSELTAVGTGAGLLVHALASGGVNDVSGRSRCSPWSVNQI